MNDSEIISLYISRSESAIAETRTKYGSYCHTIAYNILGSREEAEECVNDTYLHIWKSIPPKKPTVFSSFIAEITRNTAISRYRKRKAARRGAGQTEAALSELAECVDMNSDVVKENEQKLLTEAVTEFLSELTSEKRIIFIQRYWYMMSLREISEKNRIKEGKVKSMLFRMRNELKKFLIEKELY